MGSLRAVFLAKDAFVAGAGAACDCGDDDQRRLRLARGAGEGLRRLRDAGFAFPMIAYQPEVARGQCDEDDIERLARRLAELLATDGCTLAAFAFCPHDPRGVRRGYATDCLCRTPRPGLLTRLVQEHGIDMARSWLIASTLDEVEAGLRAGCRTILVDDGRELEWRLSETRLPHHVAESAGEAALLVLEDEQLLDWRRRAVGVAAR